MAATTQSFVPIKEVRDGTVVLKDGSIRAILLVSSVNFSLKSEDEQTSILLQFQNFLNSLDFPIEMSVQSRRLDIRPYLALLAERQKVVTEELLKIQIREYVEFIKSFTERTSIMTKSFFIVVPYYPASLDVSKSGPLGSVFGRSNAPNKQSSFEEAQSQLEERVSVVEQGITRTGLRAVRLGSEEVVELFYKIFNPGEAVKPIQLS